jgi:hypothetical protein
VTAAAEDELDRAGRSIGDCPWIPYWFDFYRQRDAAHIARALVRFAPEAASASSLGEAIGAVTRRVRDTVRRSLEAGRPIGVPAGVPAYVFDPHAAQRPPAGIASIDPILNEAPRSSAPSHRDAAAPERAPIGGTGRPLETATRTRMEAAFRTDFGDVRLHTGAEGQTAAGRMHARAFALGSDVAFAPGQHRPGTPVGDALLAHELAHVLQQRPAGGAGARRAVADAPASTGGARIADLETDANRMAGSAVGALEGLAAGPIVPRRTASLAVARCGEEDDLTVQKVVQVRVVRLFDSTGNPDTDIAAWNTHIRPQANMRMQKVADESLSEDRTEELIGQNRTLGESSCGNSTEEERLRQHFGSRTVLPALYLKEIEGPFIGEQIHGGCGSNTVAVIDNFAHSLTLSHEAGHAMGLDHREKTGNLMQAAPGLTDSTLEDDQIRTIRSSSFAQ